MERRKQVVTLVHDCVDIGCISSSPVLLGGFGVGVESVRFAVRLDLIRLGLSTQEASIR